MSRNSENHFVLRQMGHKYILQESSTLPTRFIVGINIESKRDNNISATSQQVSFLSQPQERSRKDSGITHVPIQIALAKCLLFPSCTR
jgi:hypothetical protein